MIGWTQSVLEHGPGRRALGRLAVVGCLTLAGIGSTQDAIANGDTRTISLVHMHTKEELTVTFKRWGQYDPSALAQLNRFLRDWRNDDQVRMDPRLFDVLWQVMRQTGSSGPAHVLSAYRSPSTNAMLRRRSRGVAKASHHVQGKAIDIRLMDVSMRDARDVAIKLQLGGVGYYPSSHTPFMHLDVGSVRSWPRLTRDQLARIFPDGRTVHLPAGGGTMPGYEQARAEIIARGGTVMGLSTYAENEESFTGRRKSLWAMLFGGGADEDEDLAEAKRGSSRQPVRRGGQTRVAAQSAAPSTGDDNGVYAFMAGQPSDSPGSTPGLSRPGPTRLAARLAPQAPTPPPAPEAPPKPEAKPEEKPAVKPVQIAALPKTWLPATAPVPSSRPRGLDALVASLKPDEAKKTDDPKKPEEPRLAEARLVHVPLPPERPTNLPGAKPEIAPDAIAEKPTDKPSAKPVLVATPLPPPRPASAGLSVAAAEGETPPAGSAEKPSSLAFATPRATGPADRPAPALPTPVLRGIVPAPQAARAPLPPPRPNLRASLKELLTAPNATPVAAPATAPVRVARARSNDDIAAPPVVAASLPPAPLRTSFSANVDSDLVTGSFVGPAVKAIPKAGFSR